MSTTLCSGTKCGGRCAGRHAMVGCRGTRVPMQTRRIVLSCVLLAAAAYASAETSCSTFLLSGAGSVLVGHNLDDSIETPGMLLVNPRGMTRRGARYQD